MSERKIRQLIIGMCLLLPGITLVELVWAYAVEYSTFSIGFYTVLGSVAALIGLVGFIRPGLSKKEHELDYVDTSFQDEKAMRAEPKLGAVMEKFRKDWADFYAAEQIGENSEIQYDTTQYYKNILDLHKKRLDRLGVKMTVKAARRSYTNKSVRSSTYFDGKYQIREAEEEIEAFRRYAMDDKTLLVRHDAEVAHYTMIHAKQTSEDQIICPSCGNPTTRENLIDGCDYCGTQFTVEDLGEKISDFALRENYQIAYTKYKKLRSLNMKRVSVLVFAIFYVLFSLVGTMLMFDETTSGAGASDPVSPLFLLWGTFAVYGVFSVIFTAGFMLLYTMTIFPAIEIRESWKYYNKKKMEQMKEAMHTDYAQEQKVRQFDSLFSLTGFYSNVQSKLSLMLFHESSNHKYSQVMDYEIDRLQLENYRINANLQMATVRAELLLYELNQKKVKERREQLKLMFVKSAECKTQAVCAPYVMRCRQCGASLSSSNGYVCRYCGTKLDVKQYDWELVEMVETG